MEVEDSAARLADFGQIKCLMFNVNYLFGCLSLDRICTDLAIGIIQLTIYSVE